MHTPLKSDAPQVQAYYKSITRLDRQGVLHEGAVKPAFHALLEAAAGARWALIAEHTPPGKRIRYDGVLRDTYGFTLGHWEAKDSRDDLDAEVQKKFARGYSRQNIIFQAPERAVLYQDGKRVCDADLTDPGQLVGVLDLFFGYSEPEVERFHEAVAVFKEKIPDLARGLLGKIREGERENELFQHAFVDFLSLCRESINPNLSQRAAEEMLVQHLLTERLYRTVFKNRDFANRNAIAREIERVVVALTSASFSREDFLGRLDNFYRAIEEAAEGIKDWSEKQGFINTVYEQFFQGFSVDVADTHGIVYTPQPLVDFMVRSTDVLLRRHFGQGLADGGVHVLDPFVGTGNFLVRVMAEVPAPDLPAKYRTELHANEVMLLPYYVASQNLEHAYYERTGRYEPFEGIVLVDTFEMAEGQTLGMFSAENTERAQRQREAPIKVVIGNPPYNAHQVNANDANQNRKYPHIDGRIRETYAASSAATLKNKLYDPYVRAFRWASDRIGDQGVVAFVTNDSFLNDLSFDGMRRHLVGEFDEVYVVALGGNVRKDPRLSGTTHNVFGIQVGVAITFLVRTGGRRASEDDRAALQYAEAAHGLTKEKKYDWLNAAGDIDGLDWRELRPNRSHAWLTGDLAADWDDLLPLVSKAEKASDHDNETTICDQYSNGVKTNRDAWAYNFDRQQLAANMERMADAYDVQVSKWLRRKDQNAKPSDFARYDDQVIKWSGDLNSHLKAGRFADFDADEIRRAMYRPFVTKWLYFDHVLLNRRYLFPYIFPGPNAERENRVICISDKGYRTEFSALMLDRVGDVHLLASADAFQYVPFYIYEEDGTRVENLTDWALHQFRERYGDDVSKEDVFHYVYAVLHHPDYRQRYGADLRRSLPRIPFAPTFWPFVEAGRRLAELHLGFETGPTYPLELDSNELFRDHHYTVERMKWVDEKRALQINGAITLRGFPPAAHRYVLGNRSALDWLVDQIRVKEDRRSGIVHDPNAAFGNDELVQHIRRVTHLSVETVRIVEDLPDLGLPD